MKQKPIAALAFLSLAGGILGIAMTSRNAEAQTAQNPSANSNQLQTINCFQYYKFGSVKLNFAPEKYTYAAGDTIKFKGTVTNENAYPVADGGVYVKIYRRDKQGAQAQNGEFQVSQFWGVENLPLSAKQQRETEFQYQLPTGLAKGEYLAQFFFTSAGKYYLAGLPFQVATAGGAASFKIDGAADKAIYFDKENVQVNGEKYDFRAINKPVGEGKEILITVPLWNPTETPAKISLRKNLFYWDDLNAENLLAGSNDTLVIPPGQKQDVAYTITKPERSAYLLQLTASDSRIGQTTINIRPLVSGISQARLSYSGLASFPLVKSGKSVMFACFHNTSDGGSEGKVVLTLKDEEGKTISQKAYEGKISSEVMGAAQEISPDKNYGKVQLAAELYDKTGKLIDSSNQTYDCGQFNPGICGDSPKSPSSPVKAGVPQEAKFFALDWPESPTAKWLRKLTPLLVVLVAAGLAAGVLIATKKFGKGKNKPKNKTS